MFRVQPVDLSDDQAISDLFARFDKPPYSRHSLPVDQYPAWAMAQIEDQLEHPGAGLLGLFNGKDELVGIAGYGKLDFDTRHFGYEMGRIEPFWVAESAGEISALLLLEQAVADLVDQGVENIYIRVGSFAMETLRAATALGFYIVDTVVEYQFDFSKKRIPEKNYDLEMGMATAADEAQLLDLTRRTFDGYLGRFHSDPHFMKDRATEMYVLWMKNSLSGKLADDVLVAKIDGKVAGFLTLNLQKNLTERFGLRHAEGVLAGVAPFAQGKGVYRSVIHESLFWFSERSDKVKVVTQVNNHAVQNAWTSLGFRLFNSYYTLHYWDK